MLFFLVFYGQKEVRDWEESSDEEGARGEAVAPGIQCYIKPMEYNRKACLFRTSEQHGWTSKKRLEIALISCFFISFLTPRLHHETRRIGAAGP